MKITIEEEEEPWVEMDEKIEEEIDSIINTDYIE